MKIERKTVRKAGGFGAGQAPDPLTLVVGSTEYKEEDSTITIPQPVQVISDGTTDYYPDASGKVTIPGGGGGVSDVTLNGSSVVSGGVAAVNAATTVTINGQTKTVDAGGNIDLGEGATVDKIYLPVNTLCGLTKRGGYGFDNQTTNRWGAVAAERSKGGWTSVLNDSFNASTYSWFIPRPTTQIYVTTSMINGVSVSEIVIDTFGNNNNIDKVLIVPHVLNNGSLLQVPILYVHKMIRNRITAYHVLYGNTYYLPLDQSDYLYELPWFEAASGDPLSETGFYEDYDIEGQPVILVEGTQLGTIAQTMFADGGCIIDLTQLSTGQHKYRLEVATNGTATLSPL